MKRCDLTFVKATNRGGRLHSAVYDAKDLYNGTLGYLGGYVAGSTEIRTFAKPTATLIANAMPVIVMKPEIVYDEKKRRLGDFINPKGKAFPVVPLENLDGFDLSSDYFDLTGKQGVGGQPAVIAVGDVFLLQPGIDELGKQLKYNNGVPANADVNGFYFRVVGIRDSHIANFVFDDGVSTTAGLFPQPYKMVALEVVKL